VARIFDSTGDSCGRVTTDGERLIIRTFASEVYPAQMLVVDRQTWERIVEQASLELEGYDETHQELVRKRQRPS